MNVTRMEKNGKAIVELAAGSGAIRGENDALDLIAACMENSTWLLLIDSSCLPEEFFRLRTGLAGAVVQKLTNYGVQAAVLAPPGAAQQGKFKDFMLETNRGNQFRLFEGREDALDWLTGK